MLQFWENAQMELVFNILDIYCKKECKLYQTSKSRALLIAAPAPYMPAVRILVSGLLLLVMQ